MRVRRYLAITICSLFVLMGLYRLVSASASCTPTPTPTATPTPTGIPSPPMLSNSQVFKDGAVFGGHIVNGTGSASNDNYAALQSALNAGDVDIKAGTYVINAPNSFSGITPVSGRKIYCENPYSSLPAKPSSPVVLKIPFYYSGGNASVFSNWNSGELYGCEVEGYHYPNTSWTGDSGNNLSLVNFSVINNSPTAPGGFKAYGNGIDGWPGFTGDFVVYADRPSWVANNIPVNIDVSYNRFANCNNRAMEIDMATNVTFTHNSLTDCEEATEIQYPTNLDGSGHPQQTVLFDHNTFNWVVGGQGGSSSGWVNVESAGAVCHGSASTPWQGACKSSESVDYSQTTFSDNVISGPQINWMLESEDCLNGAFGLIKGVYRGNTCTGVCAIQCAPGNPNANVWGAGSNQ